MSVEGVDERRACVQQFSSLTIKTKITVPYNVFTPVAAPPGKE